MSDKEIKVKAYSNMFVTYLLGKEGNEDILLAFINEVLSDAGFNKILAVEIKNPFNLVKYKEGKLTILDVKAIDENKRIFNVEIQAQGNENHKARVLYYWSKCYSDQIKSGEDYHKLEPVISINLLNFKLLEDKDLHSYYWLTKATDNDKVLSDHLILHFIELPKLGEKKKLTPLELWAYYFLYEGEKDMEFVINHDEVLKKAHEEYLKFTQDEELKEIYEAQMKAESDYKTQLVSSNLKSELKGEIKILDKLFNEGTITEEKYKIEVEPLKKKLDELSKRNN